MRLRRALPTPPDTAAPPCFSCKRILPIRPCTSANPRSPPRTLCSSPPPAAAPFFPDHAPSVVAVSQTPSGRIPASPEPHPSPRHTPRQLVGRCQIPLSTHLVVCPNPGFSPAPPESPPQLSDPASLSSAKIPNAWAVSRVPRRIAFRRARFIARIALPFTFHPANPQPLLLHRFNIP